MHDTETQQPLQATSSHIPQGKRTRHHRKNQCRTCCASREPRRHPAHCFELVLDSSIPPMALMFCVSMMVSQRRWHFMTWLKWSMVCMEMSTSSRILSLLSTNTSCADAPITACMQLCQPHSHSVSFAPTSTSSLCTHWVDGQHLETSRVDRKALVISQSKRRREESVVLGLVVALITPIARLFTHQPSRDVQQHTTQPCLFVVQWSWSCQRR